MRSTDEPLLISTDVGFDTLVWPAARERQVRTDIGFAFAIDQVMAGIMIEVIAESWPVPFIKSWLSHIWIGDLSLNPRWPSQISRAEGPTMMSTCVTRPRYKTGLHEAAKSHWILPFQNMASGRVQNY